MTGIITDNLLTTEDCCRLLGVTRATLQRYIKIGRFPAPLDLPYQRKYWKQSNIDDFFAPVGATVDKPVAGDAIAPAPSGGGMACGVDFGEAVSKIIQDKRRELGINNK